MMSWVNTKLLKYSIVIRTDRHMAYLLQTVRRQEKDDNVWQAFKLADQKQVQLVVKEFAQVTWKTYVAKNNYNSSDNSLR